MDGKRVRSFFSNEVRALLDTYNQFAILIPSLGKQGAAHVGEDGRYVEALIREQLGKYLPKGVELLTGFILRPSTKTGENNRERNKENDRHSTQLDIIVYDSEHYPIYQRFDKNVIVPPEGVIGIISIKKTLRDQDIEHEVKALYEASRLCLCIDDKHNRTRGPYLALVSVDSDINKEKQSTGEWIFSRLSTFYESDGIADDLGFNDMVGLITSLKSFSVFKARPEKNANSARYVELIHKEGEEFFSLQFILTGLLSVYYDPTRNNISRPGFTSFESGRPHDNTLGKIKCKHL